MYKTRLIIFITIVVIAAIYLTYWLWQRQQIQAPVTVKIGALLPAKDGDLKINRQMMINGMLLAKEFLEEKYKKKLKIEYFFEDGCFSRDSVPAVKKFITENVSIIGASFCLFGHLPILKMTEGNQIITFNTAANPDKSLNLNFAFSTNVEVKDESLQLSEFAYNKLGARKAVIMYLDTPFGKDYSKYFTRDFTKRGGQVVGDFPNAPDGKQFAAMVEKIKELKPDIIITAHFGVPLGMFINAVRKAGISTQVLGNYEMEDRTVIEYAGDGAEGIIFSSSEQEPKTAVMKEFDDRYIRKFGEMPNSLAANAYDNVLIAVEKYMKCNGNRQCVADNLRNIKDYQGASGVITIKNSGATKKPTIFKVIRHNTFIRFYEVSRNEN